MVVRAFVAWAIVGVWAVSTAGAQESTCQLKPLSDLDKCGRDDLLRLVRASRAELANEELANLDAHLVGAVLRHPHDAKFAEAHSLIWDELERRQFIVSTERCGLYQSVRRPVRPTVRPSGRSGEELGAGNSEGLALSPPSVEFLDRCGQRLLSDLVELKARIDRSERAKQEKAEKLAKSVTGAAAPSAMQPSSSPSPSPAPTPTPTPTPRVIPRAVERGALADDEVPEPFLRDAHHAYKSIKTWLKPCLSRGPHEVATPNARSVTSSQEGNERPTAPAMFVQGPCQGDADPTLLRRASTTLDQLRETTHDLLASRGLRQLVAAQFVSGYVRTIVSPPSEKPSVETSTDANADGSSPGSEGGASAGPGTGQQVTSSDSDVDADDTNDAAGHVVWSTRHFCVAIRGCDTETARADRWSLDFSLGGLIGIQPALTLVAPETPVAPNPSPAPSPSPGPSPSPAPQGSSESSESVDEASHQAAYVWNIGVDVHAHKDRFEATGSLRWGQTILVHDLNVLRTPDGGSLVVPSGGESGNRAAEEWEISIALRYHFQRLEVLHEQNGLIAPALEVGGGIRNNSRFKREGDSAVFADAWRRYYFRFMARGVTVTGVPASEQDKSRLFKLNFGVEHEWGGTVPKSTRLLIEGDVNLIKAIRGR
jgi:hypothetical protein